MKSERGAMLVMVAISLVALTLFSAVVLDYGIFWTARGQAQNSADAGVLAAAEHTLVAPADLVGARESGRRLANANAIWGEAPLTPNIDVDLPITCPAGTGGGLTCVKVTVHRGSPG